MKFLRIKLAIFFFIITLSVTLFANNARAGYWGESFASEAWKQMMETIMQQIQGVILGAAKQAAVQMIQSQVNNLIGGGSGSGQALFIQDWTDYLYKKPAETTQIYMKDLLTTRYGGRNSSSNYTSASGGSYTASIEKQMQAALAGNNSKPAGLDELGVSDPSQMFSDPSKGWRPFNSFLDYNPTEEWLFYVQPAYLSKLEKEQKKAEIQAIAYKGFNAQEQNGQVVTPGSTIKDIQSQTEDLGNKIIASAQNIPEVITAIVTKMVTKTITQGIGQASQNVQRQANTKINSVFGH